MKMEETFLRRRMGPKSSKVWERDQPLHDGLKNVTRISRW